ncbi:MAG TPA: PA domain-containing protein, partial [Candidatus Saccharimonadia bacterium]|nr:PA domain-containing protein [Candidatus Saccharimonadia bacterium]
MASFRMLFGALSIFSAALLIDAAAHAATISIVNNDGPGEGFNDTTPVAALPNNPGTTRGAQRLNVFTTAAAQWGAVLNSPVTILIRAQFDPQTCDANGAILGSAGPISVLRDFTNAPLAGTWFAVAEANAVAGTDLSAADPDINTTFNVSIDAGCLSGTTGWWYGLDSTAPVPADRIALMPVVFHEIAHGLGFLSLTNSSTGQLFGTPARPDVWAHFLKDANLGASGTLWKDMSNGQRAASAIDDPNLVWDGALVTARGSSYLDPPAALVVNSPAGIAGTYPAQTASYGLPPPLSGLTGDVVLALDAAGIGTTTDGCETITNAAQVSGRIALVDRGTCTFVTKSANVQAAGATGLLVANNVATGLPGMGGSDASIVIPSYGITQSAGNAIKANLAGGVNVKMGYDFAALAGTTAGKVRMFAPNPLQQGSSVSHFSADALPNLLMEPALNQELFSDVDLTVALFNDIFWPMLPQANRAPALQAAAEYAATVDVQSPLTEMLFSDVDSGTGNLTLRFQVASGTIVMVDQPSIVEAGSGTADASATGSRQALLPYVTNGNARFLSAPGSTAQVPLTLTISDNGNSGTGGARSTSASATIIVSGAAVPAPVANDDVFAVTEDATLNQPAPGVLGNDTGPMLTASLVSGPASGSLTLNPNGSFAYSPAANDCGTPRTFTYDAVNSGGSESATVTLNIGCINDVPSFTKGADQTVLEDAGAQSIANWASAISTGPANESGQTVSFNVTNNTNTALFSTQPTVAANGTLSFTPAANANGSA